MRVSARHTAVVDDEGSFEDGQGRKRGVPSLGWLVLPPGVRPMNHRPFNAEVRAPTTRAMRVSARHTAVVDDEGSFEDGQGRTAGFPSLGDLTNITDSSGNPVYDANGNPITDPCAYQQQTGETLLGTTPSWGDCGDWSAGALSNSVQDSWGQALDALGVDPGWATQSPWATYLTQATFIVGAVAAVAILFEVSPLIRVGAALFEKD